MTCQELSEFLMDYLDGTLACQARAVFDQHLADCPECRAYLSSYQTTIQLGRAALCESAGTLPEPLPPELVAAIVSSRRSDRGGGQQVGQPSLPASTRMPSD